VNAPEPLDPAAAGCERSGMARPGTGLLCRDDGFVRRVVGAGADPEVAASHLAGLESAACAHGVALHADDVLAVAPLLALDAPAARLISRPRWVRWLARTSLLEEERPDGDVAAEVRKRLDGMDPTDFEGMQRMLRLVRHREMLRVGLRDLTRRATLASVVRELTRLADALLQSALAFCDRMLAARFGAPLGGRFCVVAMGKLGACELNYSSDVDLIFAYDDEGPGAAAQDLAVQAAKLAAATMRALSEVTVHGFAFRTDANLRPDGRAGPLSASVGAMERYYERAGQTWERAALIKARPCAGGPDVGRGLLDRLRPFVWPRSLDMAAVESIAAMKRRVDAARAALPGDSVKLGRGGIREVEFHAQAMQLLHGGRLPALRVRGTLEALDALVYAGLLPAADRDALSRAYVFLRDVEHRLQLPGDRQTHELPAPSDARARLRLARLMGCADAAGLDAALAGHRDAVHDRFRRLLGTAADEHPHRPEVALAISGDAGDDERDRALSSMGFSDAVLARTALDRLARRVDGAFSARGRERHPGLAERLLEAMADSPAPDQALARFLEVTAPLWAPASVDALFAANFATARLLLLLFATSEALTRDFQLHPETLDALVRRDAAALRRDRASLAAEVRDRLAHAPDAEAALGVLRRVRHEEALRVGLHDLAGRLDDSAVGQQLTTAAEVLLEEALRLAREEVAARWGEPSPAPLAVLGLGSLGARELRYQSDLDLVFVHDASGATSGGDRGSVEAAEWASRVAQRLLSSLTMPMVEGALYRVDSRLRPSGSQGPLVASVASLGAYHAVGRPSGARQAALWERQALLRARPVAGDVALGERVVREVLDPAVYERPMPSGAAAQIAAMRRRLDAPVGMSIDPRRAPGGILDVEFAVQFLQLRHRVRAVSTREALPRLVDVGALSQDDAAALSAAHERLRRVESRLRLAYARPEVFVPLSGPGLAKLARQLGDAGAGAGERLLRDLRRTMERTRALFERLVA